jgi:DNA-binding LacI/PurR family transcriptional regulator
LINAETRERIRPLPGEHNFRMNASARNLRTRSSRTIAFVAPTYFQNFFQPKTCLAWAC